MTGFDDYLKIDYSLVKPKKEDYTMWKVYFQDLCLYIKTKFRNCYGSKEFNIQLKSKTIRQSVINTLRTDKINTADAVANKIGMDKLAVRPRFSELRALGLIRDTGQRGVNKSGKSAIIWELV